MLQLFRFYWNEIFNKKDYIDNLLKIYNKYNFLLKDATLNNIIYTWKNSSLKFTKYSALENKINSKGDLILCEYAMPIVYLSNKKQKQICEYFIWSHDSLILEQGDLSI